MAEKKDKINELTPRRIKTPRGKFCYMLWIVLCHMNVCIFNFNLYMASLRNRKVSQTSPSRLRRDTSPFRRGLIQKAPLKGCGCPVDTSRTQ